MAHEVVTLRKNKGSALTYEELDSNFENYIEFKGYFATNETDGSTSFPNFVGGNDGKFLYWDNTTGTVGVKAIDEKNAGEATELFKKAQPLIDSLARKGIIHKNKAANQKRKLIKGIKLIN